MSHWKFVLWSQTRTVASCEAGTGWFVWSSIHWDSSTYRRWWLFFYDRMWQLNFVFSSQTRSLGSWKAGTWWFASMLCLNFIVCAHSLLQHITIDVVFLSFLFKQTVSWIQCNVNYVKTVCDCGVLFALGLHTQWHVLYNEWCCVWSSWWNTESYAASCCTGDTQSASVNTHCNLCTVWSRHHHCHHMKICCSPVTKCQEHKCSLGCDICGATVMTMSLTYTDIDHCGWNTLTYIICFGLKTKAAF